MVPNIRILVLVVIGILQYPAVCQDTLSDHLEPLRPFLNKTWKGKVAETAEKLPIYDIAKWERILNGMGIRILHSVNDGAYGGETIIRWDSEKDSLVFYYFTTAGFYTSGTMKFEKGKLISNEHVKGNKNGISEVKAISQITAEGKMEVESQTFKDGEWSEAGLVVYVEDANARVIFK